MRAITVIATPMLDTALNRGKVLGMETNPTPIQEAQDVTPECLLVCEDIFNDWFDYDDEPIDWYAFYDRLENRGWCLTDTDSPASRKIQRHIRKHRSNT